MAFYLWMRPLGMVTFTLLFITVMCALFKNFKWHKVFAVITAVAVACHILAVILSEWLP